MPLMAQMTPPGGILIPYVVSLIKINIFPIFRPKMWKIALCTMATSKSYNSDILEWYFVVYLPNYSIIVLLLTGIQPGVSLNSSVVQQ